MRRSAAAQEFGGLRVEGRVGWDNVGVDLRVTSGIPASEFGDNASTISYGGEVGYDLTLGGAVVGAYAGMDFAKAKGCDSVFGNDRACLKVERNITVGGRVGVPVTPQVLLYAKGGYSNGRVSARYLHPGSRQNEPAHQVGEGLLGSLAEQQLDYGKAAT